MKYIALYGTLAVSLIATLPVVADQNELLEEQDLFAEIPLVGAATRLPQPIDQAPVAVTLITKELIKASAATEVAQLLKLVPGFLSYYVAGNQFGVTRGLGRRFPGDLEILIDGRSGYEAIYSTTEWSSIGVTVDDIEYIEVVRGSNTPAYGSNAFLGAINIVTTTPIQDSGTRIKLSWGDNHTRNLQIRHFGRFDEGYYSLNAFSRHNDGFDRWHDPVHGNTPIQDSSDTAHLKFRGVYSPSLHNTFELDLGVGKGQADIPREIGVDQLQFVHRDLKNHYQSFKWRHEADQDNVLNLQFTHNLLKVNQYRDIGLFSSRVAELLKTPEPAVRALFQPFFPNENIVVGLKDGVSERYELELQNQRRWSDHRLVLGSTVRQDRLRAIPQTCGKSAIDEWLYRGFANWEWRVNNNVTTNLGLMAEKTATFDPVFSSRLAVNYQFHPGHTLRASYTNSRRTPSLLEANLNECLQLRDSQTTLVPVTTAAKDLNPPRVQEYEVGYISTFSDGLLLDAKAYITRMDNELGLLQVNANDNILDALIDFHGIPAGAPSPLSAIDRNTIPDNFYKDLALDNAESWQKKGLELGLQYKPDSESLIHLAYAYTELSGKRVLIQQPETTSNLGDELPKHSLSLLVKRTLLPGFDASLLWSRLSDYTPSSGDPVEHYDRLDLRLAYQFQLTGTTSEVELIVHNLLDDQYTEFEVFNQFDRRILLQVSVDFD